MNAESTHPSPPGGAPTENGAVNMDWAFEQSPDCIKVMGLDGALQGMNRNGQCAMEIDDFSAVLGALWPNLWPADARHKVIAAMESAGRGGEGHFDAFCPTAKGTAKWWDVLVSPILTPDGQVKGLLAVSRDISDVHRAVEQQRELSARLQFTLDVAEYGEWDLDLTTMIASCTLRHDQCFGYSEPQPDWTFAAMLAHIHPADRARVEAAVQAAHDGAPTVRFEARVVWPDGSVHWISAHGSRYLLPGRTDRMIGLVSDITERMRVTEALQEASRNKDEFLAMLAHELRNPLAAAPRRRRRCRPAQSSTARPAT